MSIVNYAALSGEASCFIQRTCVTYSDAYSGRPSTSVSSGRSDRTLFDPLPGSRKRKNGLNMIVFGGWSESTRPPVPNEVDSRVLTLIPKLA